MGVVMKVRIPTCYDKPGTTQIVQLTQQVDSHISVILPTVHEVDLFRCFCPVFLHSQMLWELVLLGEPIVVMAPSPSESSETVLALVNCISPLKYFSDFRPYFTIHDSEFKEYTTRTQAPPSVILGVTNPFFAKTLQHWPHIIRIGDLKPAGEIPKQVKVKKLKNLKTLDSKPGVYTSYKPYLNRDEEIIKQLQKKHTEVEIVDLVLKLKNKLLQADREHLPVKPDTMEKLRTHIDAIILALPEDLQGILLKTGMT
uniref:DENN domain containing 6A n=1 Tax=Spermophilus dauricus TaxID=99837 RepID=A0A8C9UVZ5_SPEDA